MPYVASHVSGGHAGPPLQFGVGFGLRAITNRPYSLGRIWVAGDYESPLQFGSDLGLRAITNRPYSLGRMDWPSILIQRFSLPLWMIASVSFIR